MGVGEFLNYGEFSAFFQSNAPAVLAEKPNIRF